MKAFFIGSEKQIVCPLNWADFFVSYSVRQAKELSPTNFTNTKCMSVCKNQGSS